LYEQGYTIGGARVFMLRDTTKDESTRKVLIHEIVSELEEILLILE